MKKYITTILIFTVCTIINAQNTVSLETMSECVNRPNYDDEGCPDLEDVDYIKDINNKLNQFVGTWKGSYNGNNYEITLVKKEKVKLSGGGPYWDKLVGGLIIRNSAGSIVYNDTDKINSIENASIYGSNFQKPTTNFYNLSFSPKDKCIKGGQLTIYFKKGSNNTQLLLSIWRQADLKSASSIKECNNERYVFPYSEREPDMVLKRQ
ncbi:hypothetical protein M2T82_09175 [Elizabethkingia ursingii]|uniref:DUF6705 family protein n=1 Tax=Elizabethkingia ursingii TaxID=1756150 RepID=UPI002011DEA4|nr:DUF6705 family protein [Elizabethkingia ursingii]MCL1668229.1 hypothetical protein [Elizabethkingia ursingii]